MAMALMAWLTAPAPIAWTSARLCSRTTPAMAPATAEVRDPAETLMVSIRPPPLAEEHRASVRAVVARLYRIQDSESSVSHRGVALHLHAVGEPASMAGGRAGVIGMSSVPCGTLATSARNVRQLLRRRSEGGKVRCARPWKPRQH